MPYKCLITLLAMILSLVACGQKPQRSASNTSIHKTEQTMDLSKITNEQARQAIEAWQQGDSTSFLSFFVANARLTDDGHPRDFANFVKTACGHERFTSIDKVENNGLDIYGNFHLHYLRCHLCNAGRAGPHTALCYQADPAERD